MFISSSWTRNLTNSYLCLSIEFLCYSNSFWISWLPPNRNWSTLMKSYWWEEWFWSAKHSLQSGLPEHLESIQTIETIYWWTRHMKGSLFQSVIIKYLLFLRVKFLSPKFQIIFNCIQNLCIVFGLIFIHRD